MKPLARVIIISIFLVVVLLSPFAFSIDDLLALQGNVDVSGVGLTSGNLTVYIFDAHSGGNVIYNSTGDFNDSISDGKFDVTLGNGSHELDLEYGRVYYLEMYVNNEIFTFNGTGARQMFQASTGQINGSFINHLQINDTHFVYRYML